MLGQRLRILRVVDELLPMSASLKNTSKQVLFMLENKFFYNILIFRIGDKSTTTWLQIA